MNKIIARNREHLKKLIEEEIKINGFDCNLNHIDISYIKDISAIFQNLEFNGDISEWNVSKVENMERMFCDSKFNGDISKWDISNVKDMESMFYNSEIEEKPWWNIEDDELREKLIKLKELENKLDNKLEEKEKTKKMKI